MKRLVALVLVAGALIVGRVSAPSIPHCYEDQVIVGAGDFEHGTWSRYECGPAVDDFIAPPIVR